MRPSELKADDFARFGPVARAFAVAHLPLLQRLPIAICPSFLDQIEQLDTSFPAEQSMLRRHCDFLSSLQSDHLSELMRPFEQIRLSSQLMSTNWLHAPAKFIAELTAELWSSGQIDRFRAASIALFRAMPEDPEQPDRLTMVVLGQGTERPSGPILRKLGSVGLTLTALRTEEMDGQIFEAFRRHASTSDDAYAHWYVDGGQPWRDGYDKVPGTIAVSYPELDSIRVRTLKVMEQVLEGGNAGAEQMRARLMGTTADELGAGAVTVDPILQRFYVELFTQSSGPQIFSTSFVQWTGRELARRARPRTLLLRYAPRRRYQPFNEMLSEAEPEGVDADGALRDAEMSAYYTWIEMNRITSPGKGAYFAWLEGSSLGVVVGNGAPAGAMSGSEMNLEQVLKTFC